MVLRDGWVAMLGVLYAATGIEALGAGWPAVIGVPAAILGGMFLIHWYYAMFEQAEGIDDGWTEDEYVHRGPGGS